MQDSSIETNIWKKIVGKAVPELAYSSNKLKEAYLNVLPKLDPSALTNNHVRMSDLESRVEQLTRENQTLRTKLAEVSQRRTLEELLKYFAQEQKTVLKEAFDKSVPIAAVMRARVC